MTTSANELAWTSPDFVLNKDKPVVVFTDTVKASVEWFTLKMLGYDAKSYSWRYWLANQANEGISKP